MTFDLWWVSTPRGEDAEGRGVDRSSHTNFTRVGDVYFLRMGGRSQCPASSGWWNLHDGRLHRPAFGVKFAHGLARTAREDLWGDERGLWNRVVDVEGEGWGEGGDGGLETEEIFPERGFGGRRRREIAHAEQERRESNGDVSPQTVWVRTE